ncbi:DUF983 domain-containing protein [Algoriphagus sp.]|uniref:DUF983 domain-containing protein n=1 Tax=Algoriphagus sp. TaxID=1872435 RepID=UPI003F700391
MSKKSGLQAVLGAKCPHCREGNMFPVHVYSFRKLTQVNKLCSVCGSNFYTEPDFFYGAMYISYAFSVALVITSMVALNVLLEKPALWMYLTTVGLANVILLPLMLRYSKVLYLYVLGKMKYRGY